MEIGIRRQWKVLKDKSKDGVCTVDLGVCATAESDLMNGDPQ